MYILFELLQLLLGERIRLADQGNQVHLQFQQWATGQNLKLFTNGIFLQQIARDFIRITVTNHRYQMACEKKLTLSCSLFIVSISTALQVGIENGGTLLILISRRLPTSLRGRWEFLTIFDNI